MGKCGSLGQTLNLTIIRQDSLWKPCKRLFNYNDNFYLSILVNYLFNYFNHCIPLTLTVVATGKTVLS